MRLFSLRKTVSPASASPPLYGPEKMCQRQNSSPSHTDAPGSLRPPTAHRTHSPSCPPGWVELPVPRGRCSAPSPCLSAFRTEGAWEARGRCHREVTACPISGVAQCISNLVHSRPQILSRCPSFLWKSLPLLCRPVKPSLLREVLLSAGPAPGLFSLAVPLQL